MSLLGDLNQLLTPAPMPRSLDDLLQELLRFIVVQFQPARAYFALLDGENLSFPRQMDSHGTPIPPPPAETARYILDKVVRSGLPVLPQVLESSDPKRACSCVPLTSPWGVLGALYLEYPPASLKQFEAQQESLIFLGRYAAALITAEQHKRQAAADQAARQAAEYELFRWQQILDAWPGSVLVTDTVGNILSSNPHFSQVSGYTAEEILGQPIGILNTGSTPAQAISEMWATVRRGRTWQGEFCNRRKDGSQYWVSALVAPLLDGEGNISQFFSLQQDIDREKGLQAELARLSVTDPLTGMLNRGQLFTLGEQQVREAIRYDHPLSFLLVDINHMRHINEQFGHHAGDQVLKAVADLLNDSLRDADVLGRLSGEEFAVLMPYTALPDAVLVAERLRQQAARLVVYTASGSVRFTISAGLSAAAPGMTFSGMLEQAEQAMRIAKQSEPLD